MGFEIVVTTLPGYTAQEQELNVKLKALFEQWHDALNAGAAGRFDPTCFVTDGLYPGYTEQKLKILFIGREAHNVAAHSYIDIIHGCYKKNCIGTLPIDQYAFHRRLVCVAYGLIHNCPPWSEIPIASHLTDEFASPGGFSFAFMNFSKLSNETDSPTKVDWPAATGFLECSHAGGLNFFTREIEILDPDLIIGMNLNKFGWLSNLGEIKTWPQNKVLPRLYLLTVNGRETPLLDTHHFSAVVKDEADIYAPLVEAWQSFQSRA